MKLARFALLVTLALAATDCAGFLAALPKVVAAVADAAQILDVIDAAAGSFFERDAAARLVYERAMMKARLALSAAAHAAGGAERLSQEDVDRAFADFRAAYVELLRLVGPLGIAAPASAGSYAAGGSAVLVPEPLALRLRVED